jgi:hypothetical protein
MRRVLVLFSFLSILLLTALGRAGSGLAAAPSNDNFAGATAVASLPFSGTADTTEATLEDSEPFGCSSYVADVWYRIAAPATESLRITFSPSDGQIWAGIYQDTGGGIPGLSRSQCLNAWTPLKDPGKVGGSDAGLRPGGRRCSCNGQTEEVLR